MNCPHCKKKIDLGKLMNAGGKGTPERPTAANASPKTGLTETGKTSTENTLKCVLQ